MKLGCCVDLADLSAACELGYEFVDLSGKELTALSGEEIRKISEYLARKKIPCLGIHATFPPEVQLVGESYDKEILRRYMDGLAECAELLGVRYIGVGSPGSRRMTEGMSRKQADRQMIESLKVICDSAPGMEILLESLNAEETNYINTLREAHEILQYVDAENIGLVWDIYHFLKSGERIEGLPEGLLAEVKYLHIADPAGRRYPSVDSSRKLFDTMQKAAVLTGAEYLAVEAVSSEFEKDAAGSRAVLQV